MDYILMTEKSLPPFPSFKTLPEAIKAAQSLALSEGDVAIWQEVRSVHLTTEVLDLTIPVVPEPPRRGRPRKPKPATEPVTTARTLTTGQSPTSMVVEAASVELDTDRVWRCCIVTNNRNVIGGGDTREAAVMQAEIALGIMTDADFNDLPDTEGKRQLAEARKGEWPWKLKSTSNLSTN